MRASKITVVAVGVCLFSLVPKAYSQGSVFFDNRVIAVGLDAPFYEPDGITPLDSRYVGQLWYLDGNTWVGVGPVIPFYDGEGAGRIDDRGVDATVALPGVSRGSDALVQIRIWMKPYATYDEAAAAVGSFVGRSPTITVTTGGAGHPPSFPGFLTELQYHAPGEAAGSGYALRVIPVPEPSVLFLVGIGVLYLGGVAHRRKRNRGGQA